MAGQIGRLFPSGDHFKHLGVPGKAKGLGKRMDSMVMKARGIAGRTKVPNTSTSGQVGKGWAVLAQTVGSGVGKSQFEKRASGAAKKVYVKTSSIKPSESVDGKAYLAPKTSLFRDREKEIRAEKDLMDDMKSGAKAGRVNTDNLVVDYEETDDKVKGKYTLTTALAKRDFAKEARTNGNPDAVELGEHVLKGFESLHRLNRVYGDIKLENALVYEDTDGKKTLKIADFGKTRHVAVIKKEGKRYSGNMRFAPPEGELSKKGDVYGAGLLLIQNMEAQVLGKRKSLIRVKDKDATASPKIWGIERYIVEHKGCFGCESGGMTGLIGKGRNMRRKARNLQRRMKLKKGLSTGERAKQKEAIHSYIDQLTMEMQEDNKYSATEARELGTLLKDMTADNPEQRPTMKKARETYQEVFEARPKESPQGAAG